ncbi:hypothetical protein CIB43_00297 [Mesomycoplasma hyopneumoniae]|uniref:Uncharacterized protein n=1 Tax=Mesomycoplasma hyopneumoniae TaxID=2099 RepID=A0A223M9G6_MESHO|nr:hypothetical protein CIB43_00297 [Mesomycoplasma hyopneumoniae]
METGHLIGAISALIFWSSFGVFISKKQIKKTGLKCLFLKPQGANKVLFPFIF